LRDGHRLRLFENRVLRNMFGSKWDKEIEELRRLHNEPHDLYFATNII
jgi:hypothetical protein